jgi:hypothetical protein
VRANFCIKAVFVGSFDETITPIEVGTIPLLDAGGFTGEALLITL